MTDDDDTGDGWYGEADPVKPIMSAETTSLLISKW